MEIEIYYNQGKEGKTYLVDSVPGNYTMQVIRVPLKNHFNFTALLKILNTKGRNYVSFRKNLIIRCKKSDWKAYN